MIHSLDLLLLVEFKTNARFGYFSISDYVWYNICGKEWRAISDNPPRTSSNEDLDRLKLGQSDERTIYEVQHGTDVNYCFSTI
ncbi:hypothetical protein ACHQM5_018126 [Ranunculus cassubicifolius]